LKVCSRLGAPQCYEKCPVRKLDCLGRFTGEMQCLQGEAAAGYSFEGRDYGYGHLQQSELNLGKLFTFVDLALVPLAGVVTSVILSAKILRESIHSLPCIAL